jgi:hypothetical protein
LSKCSCRIACCRTVRVNLGTFFLPRACFAVGRTSLSVWCRSEARLSRMQMMVICAEVSEFVPATALAPCWGETAPCCYMGPRQRWRWIGKSGFAETHCTDPERSAIAGSWAEAAFRGEVGQSPSAPLYVASAAIGASRMEAEWPRRRSTGGSGRDALCCKAQRLYTFCTYWTNGTTSGTTDLVNDEVIP